MSARPPGLQRRIRAELEANIRSGLWPPGRRLPTEQALTAQYGCARMTVGRALAELAAEGLVERRKRAGTLVARPHVRAAVMDIPDIGAVIAARGEAYGFRLLARRLRAADSRTADEAVLGACGGLLALEGLHLAEGRPFALETRVMNLDAAPQAESADFDVEAPGSWLLRHVPWTNARHRIAAVNADAAMARRLEVRSGSACLQLDRWTWRMGQGVTFARQTFPGDRYDLLADFTPAAAPLKP